MNAEQKEKVAAQLHQRVRDANLRYNQWVNAEASFENGAFHYQVVLESCWADYGEKTVTKSNYDLDTAITEAEEEFKIVNGRSDIQARRKIFIVFPSGVVLEYEP